MKYFKKIIAGILLVAVMMTGLFLLACDGCEDDKVKDTPVYEENEVDLTGMWTDEMGEVSTDPTGKNDSDYTGWAK